MGQISDNRILLTAADSATGFVDLAGSAAGNVDSPPEVFIEGTVSVGESIGSSLNGLLYDLGTPTDVSGNVFYFWINCAVVGILDTKELGGFTLRFCGGTISDWFEVYAGGSNFWPKAVQGGWVQFAVDIDYARELAVATSPATDGGVNGSPPATSAIQYVGWSGITNGTMPRMIDNLWIDALYRLPPATPGIIVSGDNGGSPYNWDDVLDAADYTDPSKAWGTAKELDGIIFLNTPIQFGNAGSPNFAAHDFEDSNRVITFESQEFVVDGFYGMTVVGDSTSSTQRLVAGVNGSAGQGWTILAAPDGPRWFFEATDSNIDDLGLYGCSFTHTTVVDIDNSFVSMFDSLLIDGQRLWHSRLTSPYGGADFRRNAIINADPIAFDESPVIGSPENVAYMWSADLERIVGSSFGFFSGHAIKALVADTFPFVGNTFDSAWNANGSPDGQQTLDAAILNDVGHVILDVSGGGDSPTSFDTNSPGTTVNNNINVTLTDIQPGTEIRVYPVESPANLTEIAGIESTGSPAEFSFSGAAGLVVRVVVFHLDYVLPPANEFTLEIPTADTSFPISQIIDRNYLNP
jgi:hypothetical protein